MSSTAGRVPRQAISAPALRGGWTQSGSRSTDGTASASLGRRNVARALALPLTAVILYLAVRTWTDNWSLVVASWGADYDFFTMVAKRWLASGEFYAAHQLAGPYTAAINVDTLYPPAALFLFLPFVWLPSVLWWAVPLAVIVYLVVRWQPAIWVWPFIAMMLWWPRTQSIIVWGNTGMWIAAFLALGLWFRWPGALILIKPSLAPFALIGVRSRGWWVVAVALFVVSLPMLTDYIAALRNNVGSFPGSAYSIQDIPFIAIPLIAWMARTARESPSPPGSGDRQPATAK